MQQLRLTICFSTLVALVTGQTFGLAQDRGAREKAAREAAIAYARAYNVKADRAAGVMKIAAVPFFAGGFHIGGSGPRIPIHAHLFKEDRDLRQWLDKGRHEMDLSLKVLRVERYADFRKKYLEKEPEPGDLGDLPLRLQQAARWALDEALGKDGLIVFLGEKSKLSEGVLVRFEKGTAKVGGVLGGLNPDWKLMSALKMISPRTEKGK